MPIYDPADHEASVLRFSEEVDRLTHMGRGMRVMEAIMALIDREQITSELAATLLTPDIRDRLQDDAEKHRMIKKTTARLRFS